MNSTEPTAPTYETIAELEAARRPLSSDPTARARFDAEMTKAHAFAKAGRVDGAHGAMCAALRTLYFYSVTVAEVPPMFVAWVRDELKAQPPCLAGDGWTAMPSAEASKGPVHVAQSPAWRAPIAAAFERSDYAAVMRIVGAGTVFLRPSDCPPAFLVYVESNVEAHSGLRCDVNADGTNAAIFKFKTSNPSAAPTWARIS